MTSRYASDQELARRLADGDRAALKELYDTYSDGLAAFICAFGRSTNDAEDIVHDTFLQVWRAADQFAGRSSLKSWLYTIARNKVIDRKRRERPSVGEAILETVEDDGATPYEEVSALDDKARVAACLEQLSEPHRTAIRLVFFEELSVVEAAEVVDCPPGTIKTRIHHAKKNLLRCLSSRD